MRFLKPIAAGLALTIGVLSFAESADARQRHRHRHHNNNHHGDQLAAGIFGFAAGALLSGAFAQPRHYYYYEPEPIYAQPPVIYRQAPVYYARPDPWTPAWYASCDARFQSFNPETGYFFGFDGDYHFCY